ncbi:hypothetical protein TNCV_2560261 [Trichonephila clavipes]|uniref:Uncharacterized protein n=1 Tax=Trichonephila clavipes TaxID=2585209 RepID=A0A8X6UY42_TRICX|nr:hypothetical protein TNCV_2560261 [Trichonephila clavipes]
MEDDKAFAIRLAVYRVLDLGDYINFMVQFRDRLNNLKPAEIIAFEPIYTVDLIEPMENVLPNLEPRDIPTFERFSNSEPVDMVYDYLEQEANKGKGTFIQAVWIVIGKPSLYNLLTRAWTEHGSRL